LVPVYYTCVAPLALSISRAQDLFFPHVQSDPSPLPNLYFPERLRRLSLDLLCCGLHFPKVTCANSPPSFFLRPSPPVLFFFFAFSTTGFPDFFSARVVVVVRTSYPRYPVSRPVFLPSPILAPSSSPPGAGGRGSRPASVLNAVPRFCAPFSRFRRYVKRFCPCPLFFAICFLVFQTSLFSALLSLEYHQRCVDERVIFFC